MYIILQKSDFYFELPRELIAQYPLPQRTDSRLLTYQVNSKQLTHNSFNDLIDFLQPGDLLVLNDTRVIPARIYGQKASGGRVELLIERHLPNQTFLAHIKASKAPKANSLIYLDKNWVITVLHKQDSLYLCSVNGCLEQLLQQIGHIPLPLYITRADENLDKERYQTVYAKNNGSAAAPTAGLHFDENLLLKLQQHAVQIAYTTLHVGAGTFQPVRCENLSDHHMHSEYFSVSLDLCDAIIKTKQAGKRVIAVGTTALRSLESAASCEQIQAVSGETNIFIYPGYEFKICDGLLTNFHLPESTLLMLVSAFIGHAETMQLYDTAIKSQYRFFSYGDACLFLK